MRALFFSLSIAVLPQAVFAEPPKVVTDIAPVHALTARVMQGVDEPALLLPPRTSPHSYAMRPSQARNLAAADLVVWVGPDLTPWLNDALETLSADAARIELMALPETQQLEFREDPGLHHDDDHHG